MAEVLKSQNIITNGAMINGATAKTTPIDADMVGLMDSADNNLLKKLSWTNIKATMKTYMDTLYVALTGNQTIAGNKTFSGFTVLGDAGTGVKMKVLTGTTSSSEGGSTDVAHGLTRTKILSVHAFVDTGTYIIPEVYTMATGFWFEVLVDSTNVSVKNKPTPNSASILSKSFSVVIYYKE